LPGKGRVALPAAFDAEGVNMGKKNLLVEANLGDIEDVNRYFQVRLFSRFCARHF
jgi:hypothetical protein